jgi:hypothetical protein
VNLFVKETIMKIRHLSGPKANTTEHINNIVGQTLIALGQAEQLPLPRYGTQEWIDERNRQSRNAGPPDAYDVDPSAMQRAIDDKFKTEPPNFPFTKK